MKCFWVSWWHHKDYGPFELHTPWWITGYDEEGRTSICAAIRDSTFPAAILQVCHSYDEPVMNMEWRFAHIKPDDWQPFTSRFQRADWMEW